MRKLLLIVGLIAGLASPVRAQAPDVMYLVNISLDWIEKNSEYKRLSQPLNWSLLTPDQMKTMAINRGHNAAGVVGMYFCDSQSFFINSEADLSKLGPQSYVLHEMVHHAQCVNHRFTNDPCAKEREAYTLQAKWLRSLDGRYPKAEDKKWLSDMAGALEKHIDGVCDRLRMR